MYEIGRALLQGIGNLADSGLNSLYFHIVRSPTGRSCCGWFLCSTMSSRTQALFRLMLWYAWLVGFFSLWLCLMVTRLLPLLRITYSYLRWEETERQWQGALLWWLSFGAENNIFPRSHAVAYVLLPKHGSHGHPKLGASLGKGFSGSLVSVVRGSKERPGNGLGSQVEEFTANEESVLNKYLLVEVQIFYDQILYWISIMYKEPSSPVTNQYWMRLLFVLGTIPSKLYEFSHLLFAIPMTEVLSVSILYMKKLNLRVIKQLVPLVRLLACKWRNKALNSSVWPQSPCSYHRTLGLEENRELIRSKPFIFMVLKPRDGR